MHSVVDVSSEGGVPVISDDHATAWEALYIPSIHPRQDPNQASTEVDPSSPARQEGEAPSIPDTPCFHPDQGDPSPEEPERMTQTPPLLSRLIQGYLDQTGIEECP